MNRFCRSATAIASISASLLAARAASAESASVAYAPSEPPAANEEQAATLVQERPATLFGAGSHHVLGGFGALESGYTRIAGRDRGLFCVEGAFILDHALTIGAAGCGIGPSIKAASYGDVIHEPGDRLEIGYGGFAVRYHFLAREMLNVSIGTVVGGGAVSITNRDSDWSHDRGYAKSTDVFFAMEPRVTGYLNLTRWARLGAFAGYRAVSGIGMTNLSSKDIGGPTLGGTIQFGWF